MNNNAAFNYKIVCKLFKENGKSYLANIMIPSLKEYKTKYLINYEEKLKLFIIMNSKEIDFIKDDPDLIFD